jgi:hypothetical protein
LSGFALQDERLSRSELAAVAQQPFEGLFCPLPDEPIGKGAKWVETTNARQEAMNATITSTYTLKEIAPDALVVGVSIARKAPAQAYPDPRAPKGTTIAVDGIANGTMKVRLDRVPAKGQLDATTTVTITQPGAQGMKPRVVVQKTNVKQTMESTTP